MADVSKQISILMADDDPDDQLLVREALQANAVVERLDFVNDGEALLNYLRRRGLYAKRQHEPLPNLILLDLRMPRMGGLEALNDIKTDPTLRRIPVVVLSASIAVEDIRRSYEAGASSYVDKSVLANDLTAVVTELANYWLEIVELPDERHARSS